MKLCKTLTLLVALFLASHSLLLARQTTGSSETVENLRGQLRDVEHKEAELKLRVEQLDEDLKPENIRNHFLGVGTTRPEELRERRRSQLQLEKDRTLAELDQLLTSRLRLESAISEAAVAAFQPGGATLHVDRGPGERYPAVRVLLIAGTIIIFLGGALALFTLLRRR